MGEIKNPQPVLLFMAVFGYEDEGFQWAKRRAESVFGPIVRESELFRFDSFTSYYASTMGTVLPKRLWSFRNLIDPSELPTIKRTTNDWENEYKLVHDRRKDRTLGITRPINLDPGYLDLGKLVLASTKDHAHRIYLSQGIFAETTLIFTQKQWKSLPWSYPDYQSAGYQSFLSECREQLKFERQRTGVTE